MESLQDKFQKADVICRETKFMLYLQEVWFENRDDFNLTRLKIQTQKVKGLLEEYYPKPPSLRKEE